MRNRPTYEDLVSRIRELEARLESKNSPSVGDSLESPGVKSDVRLPDDDWRESKEMLQVVIDNIPQFIFWKDRNSEFLGCNHNFAQAAGVENPAAIRGKSDYDLAWKKEEADFFRACDRRVMENDAPEYNIIEPQLQAGGHQAWLNTNKIPLHDLHGEVVGILGTFEDVTERINTQKVLRLYERILATTDDLMSIINTDYVYEAVNDAYLKAYSKKRDEIVGKTMADLLGDAFFAQFAKPNLKRAFKGEVTTYDAWFDYPGLGKRFIHASYYPYRDDSKAINNVVVNVRDITRIKKLEHRLIQSQKMESMGTLAGGIAHDFNNILGAIMGYSQLAQVYSNDGPKVANYIDQILTASQRAKELVQQILEFSRQGNFKKLPISAELVVKEALKLMRASLPSTIELSQNIQSKPGVVMANQTQIHQVVMNLCTNAFHAMENSGGQLDVELLGVDIGIADASIYQNIKPGRYLKLVVSDSGHGMDPVTAKRVFDPYFTTKRLGKGTGMGLATVYGIVKDHGGHIKVYSEPGVGTSFHVLFPLAGPGTEDEEVIPGSLPKGDERILLVDDEKPVLDSMKQFLEYAGYSVDAKSGAYDAFEAFKAQPEKYDLVVSDMTMPKMTGDHLAQNIKSIRPEIPIILCTGFSKQIINKNIMELNVNAILMKPVTLDTLANEVRKTLDAPEGHCAT